jgi:FtsH-binding integral membrane protein
MYTAAKIASVAMWVMIGALVASFFMRSRWITIVWVSAAVVCLVCTLLVAYYKKRGDMR